jgi:hypothetical protein
MRSLRVCWARTLRWWSSIEGGFGRRNSRKRRSIATLPWEHTMWDRSVVCLGGGSIVGRVGDGRIVTMFLKRRVADKINCFDLTATITSHDSMYICTQFHLQLSSTKGEVRSGRSAYLLSRYKSYRNNIDQNEQSTCTRRAIARRGCIFMTGIRTICIKIICLPKPNQVI